jgi:uncharacterized membrane protein YphA (DoxX/SURF4 family)
MSTLVESERQMTPAGKLRGFAFPLTRILLGVVFLVAGLPKIMHPFPFLYAVCQYEVVGASMAKTVVAILPWLETLIGICLIAGIVVNGALLLSSTLLLIFVAAQASVLYRGLDAGCACFQSGPDGSISYLTLGRTAILAAISGACMCAARSRSARGMTANAGLAQEVPFT